MTRILFVLSFITFGGCASTEMTSFTDPAFKGLAFHHFLVVARSNNLSTRLWLESHLVQTLTTHRIFANESILLLPPTRKFSDEQMKDSLLRHNFDAYIVIDVGESGVESIYIPPTQATTKTTHNSTDTWTSTTSIVGGGTIEKPWADVRTTMCDASTNEVIWIADSFTGGNGYASFNTVIDSYCSKVLERLENVGLVHEPPKASFTPELRRVRFALQNDQKYINTPAAKHANSDYLDVGMTYVHSCSESPILHCVYDNSDDPNHMHCIFCDLPEAR